MVTAIILLILLLAVFFAWYGLRSMALFFFAVTFVCAVFWFYHHVTETIGLSL